MKLFSAEFIFILHIFFFNYYIYFDCPALIDFNMIYKNLKEKRSDRREIDLKNIFIETNKQNLQLSHITHHLYNLLDSKTN